MRINLEERPSPHLRIPRRRAFFLFLLLWLFCPGIKAQFQLNGTTVMTDETCFGFQPAGNFTGGSFWETQEIDLRDSFDMTFNLFLGGCENSPMDEGLVFTFQPVGASLGNYRGNMGYKGLAPTLAVELDLLPDADNGDPSGDHLAIIRDGDLNHDSPNNLTGPVPASSTAKAVQDCDWHELRIVWLPRIQTLDVYFNCERRLSYTGNIIKELFSGESKVLWGFTSGTRSSNSDLQICSDQFYPLDIMEDVTICQGSSIQLQAPVSGRSYVWIPSEELSNPFGASTSASPRQTTTYQVVIKEDCGRKRFDEVTVAVIDLRQQLDLGPSDTTVCRGTSLTLDATIEDAAYRWSTGAQAARITVDQPGDYAVTVTTPSCRTTDQISVRFTDGPGFSFGTDTVICRGEELLLTVTGKPASVQWEDGSSDVERRISQPGAYRVQAIDACGQNEATIDVAFQPCGNIYIPNAFSPNGDGVNDRFIVFGDGSSQSRILSLRVFDRWGNLVFEASGIAPGDASSAWDGTFRGRDAPAGTYIYAVEIERLDGKKTIQSGEINLLK